MAINRNIRTRRRISYLKKEEFQPMKKLSSLIFMALLLTVPLAAQKVFVDYDRSAMNNDYKTFAWAKTPDTSLQGESPLMHSRIKNAIEYHLTEGGLIEDTENPDLYVTYHTSSKEEVQLHTTSMGYGYGGGWGWNPYWGGMGMGGMGSSTTTSSTYERGSLIIDIYDAKKKEAVWRGTAQAVVKQNPQKAANQIDKAVNKIVKKYQQMRAKDGR
jgi:uncharacterized protein DUF4136